MARTKTTEERVTYSSGTRYYGSGRDQVSLIVHTGAVIVRVTRPAGALARLVGGGAFRIQCIPCSSHYFTGTMEARGELVGLTDTRTGTTPFSKGWRS